MNNTCENDRVTGLIGMLRGEAMLQDGKNNVARDEIEDLADDLERVVKKVKYGCADDDDKSSFHKAAMSKSLHDILSAFDIAY
ncbi:hypothetical protein SAMN04487969_102484 [Paenibacillus algorifonticola]|uniref:Uncharacterized protein n=1 Tax=Paenibacillus algorifonticola TaxID=684063 RepID=A0A1I2AH74_9BACL|nr:hypothetical protein [Paenibacillus algorifonticola]SFE43119.1 hypothetical protein SAMN04487969_102484 [Paenibacillus algorifonticola]